MKRLGISALLFIWLFINHRSFLGKISSVLPRSTIHEKLQHDQALQQFQGLDNKHYDWASHMYIGTYMTLLNDLFNTSPYREEKKTTVSLDKMSQLFHFIFHPYPPLFIFAPLHYALPLFQHGTLCP